MSESAPKDDYFEPQTEQNCTIHSFNNAYGQQIVTKELVMEYIEYKVADLEYKLEQAGLGGIEIGQQISKYKRDASNGGTEFKASEVWCAAKHFKNAYYGYVPLAAVKTPYLNIDIILDHPEINSVPIVVLGSIRGSLHSIAIRNLKIYDSEKHKDPPPPLTIVNLFKSLDKVFAAYAFARTRHEMARIMNLSRSVTIAYKNK